MAIAITVELNGQPPRVLCYADGMDRAATLALDRAGVALDTGGRLTIAAMGMVFTVGTWTSAEVAAKPGHLLVTWIGPDSNGSESVQRQNLAAWVADRINPMLAAGDPDVLRFGGQVGDWLSPGVLASTSNSVRQTFARAAADNIATSLQQGNDLSIGQNLLAVIE